MIRSSPAAVLCAVALLAAVAALGRADDPPAAPKRLTNDELVKMITRFGYEVKVLDKTFTQVTIDREGWRSTVRLSLSADGSNLWLDAWLGTANFPDAVPAATWRKLLARNDSLHPVAFALNKKTGRLYLTHTIPNADLTPALLREHVEVLDKSIEQTQALWKLSNFVPPVSEAGQKQLAALAGTWKAVEMNDGGTQLSAEDAAKYGYKFDKDKFDLLKEGKSTRTGQLVAATEEVPSAKPEGVGVKQLDRYDTGIVMHGIYKLDGDTLTWCYSSKVRPSKFAGDTQTSTSLLVLKREKSTGK
jgi:uncharacterized protein (TIGR03067 family)